MFIIEPTSLSHALRKLSAPSQKRLKIVFFYSNNARNSQKTAVPTINRNRSNNSRSLGFVYLEIVILRCKKTLLSIVYCCSKCTENISLKTRKKPEMYHIANLSSRSRVDNIKCQRSINLAAIRPTHRNLKEKKRFLIIKTSKRNTKGTKETVNCFIKIERTAE